MNILHFSFYVYTHLYAYTRMIYICMYVWCRRLDKWAGPKNNEYINAQADNNRRANNSINTWIRMHSIFIRHTGTHTHVHMKTLRDSHGDNPLPISCTRGCSDESVAARSHDTVIVTTQPCLQYHHRFPSWFSAYMHIYLNGYIQPTWNGIPYVSSLPKIMMDKFTKARYTLGLAICQYRGRFHLIVQA